METQTSHDSPGSQTSIGPAETCSRAWTQAEESPGPEQNMYRFLGHANPRVFPTFPVLRKYYYNYHLHRKGRLYI